MGYVPPSNPMGQSNELSSSINKLVQARLAEAAARIDRKTQETRLRLAQLQNMSPLGPEGPPGDPGRPPQVLSFQVPPIVDGQGRPLENPLLARTMAKAGLKGINDNGTFKEVVEREGQFFLRAVLPTLPSAKPRPQRLQYPRRWDPKETAWARCLEIKADSFKPPLLFPDVAPALYGDESQEECLYSPCERYAYANRILPAFTPLALRSGEDQGEVVFDGPVVIPVLMRNTIYPDRAFGDESLEVLRSLSPQELLAYRSGIKKATGTVVVAGVGLGWLLYKVCDKRSVDEVIVVEPDRDLWNWYGEALCQKLPKIKRVVHDDPYEALTAISADAYLYDIWPRYGDARHDLKWRELRKEVENAWGWGDVKT